MVIRSLSGVVGWKKESDGGIRTSDTKEVVAERDFKRFSIIVKECSVVTNKTNNKLNMYKRKQTKEKSKRRTYFNNCSLVFPLSNFFCLANGKKKTVSVISAII